MPLADQAARLGRQVWKDPNALAQEIMVILGTDVSPTTGPIVLNLIHAGSQTLQGTFSPLDGLGLPSLDLASPTAEQSVLQGAPLSKSNGDGTYTRTTTYTPRERVVLPAKVIDYNVGTGKHTLEVYPNGPGTTAYSATDATELNSALPTINSWVLVWRFSVYQVQVFETLSEDTSLLMSKSSAITLTSRDHWVVS